MAIEQLLQVQLVRIKGKEHVLTFKHPLDAPSLETFLTPYVYMPDTDRDIKAISLRHLREEASLYAYICSLLDQFGAPRAQSNDPRLKQLPLDKFSATSTLII